MNVKDFEALEEAIKAVEPNRLTGFHDDGDGTASMIEVHFDKRSLYIQDNGYIDVQEVIEGENEKWLGQITPEMYPVVTAAIAEIERQTA